MGVIQWKKMKSKFKLKTKMATIGMAGMMVSQLKHKNGVTMILTADHADRMQIGCRQNHSEIGWLSAS